MLSVLPLVLRALGMAPSMVERDVDCPAIVENTPWALYDVEMFNASGTVPGCESWICFHFCDDNPGMEFNTNCETIVNGTIVPGDTWYYCEDVTVRYQIHQDSIVVERAVEEPCSNGTGIDVVLSGNAPTDWYVTPVQDGNEMTMRELDLPVVLES